MPNRLADQPSLYLRQHADNPVDWYPWGEEALARAAAEDKPIIVSIGYSACHWCHVMAHESFEDSYIAGLMNEHFVCIKIDREERPDLDHFYMDAVQMMNNGHGGWPLNVFCLPDGRPFAGGTYFPPDDKRASGIVPWPQLLVRVSDYFQRQRADLEENAHAVLANLRAGNQPVGATGDAFPPAQLLACAEAIAQAHDDEYGGFGQAPKFPPAMALEFLLSLRHTRSAEARPALARRLDEVINTTLTAMAHGGLFDQIGGGFARYCVDRHWIIPHFEKMLYDNGLLLGLYSRAARMYPKPLYAAVVEETIGWLEREMAAPAGGYYSALDADSEGEEGRFYVWDPDRVKAVLGEADGAAFCEAYGITETGNFEHGQSQPVLLEPDFETRAAFADQRARLLRARAQRMPPGRDEKVLVAWNTLALGGLAEAAWTFGRRDWMERARALFDGIWDTLVATEGGELRLARGAYEGESFGQGVLDDYASLAEASLDLAAYLDWLEPGAAATYIDRARQLAETVFARFDDREGLGFFYTDERQNDVLQRKKEWFDNATPSGQSGLLHVARDLAQLTGEASWAERFEQLSAAYPGYAERAPQAIGHALAAITQAATGV
ncbi:MAG: thioredoxin domain-containing protein, partial [Verrucomicrobiota bacterium]